MDDKMATHHHVTGKHKMYRKMAAADPMVRDKMAAIYPVICHKMAVKCHMTKDCTMVAVLYVSCGKLAAAEHVIWDHKMVRPRVVSQQGECNTGAG